MTGKIKQLFLLEESRNRIRTPHTHTREYTFVMCMFRIIYFLKVSGWVGFYCVVLYGVVVCSVVLSCVVFVCLVQSWSVLVCLPV